MAGVQQMQTQVMTVNRAVGEDVKEEEPRRGN